ncbi:MULTISPECIES: hypothetical protein [unclassified Arsukibacterium]|uniref:hypothetical protein n=1 Tax=unclassified Arsukibacterium TaxID=2635278 RepID=UPI000C3B7CCD|nr:MULTISPECIES: hypothetical protein [unclassified Arsukibacterium]MAA93855.1 hypothetical protein [Rheinheimera sp.]MBM34409.1 hypothetical protein [Rheinheimera sp.]HAW93927.1 hypothetical protein [Candidatus Azambacteria bacterium]|tara:strand:- start:625 stop:912 length:288 start_codon:yes stop_codon:yes gene_type:complete
MENMMYDIISWVGLTICIGAFFIKDVFWLRLATLIGCSLLFVYYSHIAIPQGVISNLLVLLINAYYLVRFATVRRKALNAVKVAAPSAATLTTEN